MSDIKIEFEWYVMPLIAVMIGWPGLLIGAVAGGFIWRGHRAVGALIGAILGTVVWTGGYYFWA